MENKTESPQKLSEIVSAIQPNPPLQTPPEPKHHSFLTNKLFLLTLVIVILFTIIYAGIYLLLNSQLNKITKRNQTPQIAPSSPSPTPDPTANWKTYTNKEFGFELKYPETQLLTNNVGEASLHYPTKYFANLYTQRALKTQGPISVTSNIEVYDKPQNMPIQRWLGNAYKIGLAKIEKGDINSALQKAYSNKIGILTYSEHEAELNFYELGSVQLPQIFTYTTYITKNGNKYIYALSVTFQFEKDNTQTDEPDSKIIDTYNQILSTFKFLDERKNNLRVCPDTWVDFLSPIQVVNNPYYGQKGQFITINGSIDLIPAERFDLEWIKLNCEVKNPEPVG